MAIEAWGVSGYDSSYADTLRLHTIGALIIRIGFWVFRTILYIYIIYIYIYIV